MAREIALPFDVHTTALEEYLLLQALHRLIPPGQRWVLPGNAGLLVRNDILEMAMRLLSDSSRDLYLNYAERLPAYLRRCIDTYMPVPYGALSPSASRPEFLSWHLLNDGDAPLWTAVRAAVFSSFVATRPADILLARGVQRHLRRVWTGTLCRPLLAHSTAWVVL